VSPIPITATSYPFGAAMHSACRRSCTAYGFVEEEYLVQGKANVYDWPDPGLPRYAPQCSVRHPRPGPPPGRRHGLQRQRRRRDAQPSNLFDLNIGWALSHNHFLRNGDVWVGITAKPVAIEALKNFDPERYGELTMANPLPASDPRNCKEPTR
jgi:hypothetical protein